MSSFKIKLARGPPYRHTQNNETIMVLVAAVIGSILVRAGLRDGDERSPHS